MLCFSVLFKNKLRVFIRFLFNLNYYGPYFSKKGEVCFVFLWRVVVCFLSAAGGFNFKV